MELLICYELLFQVISYFECLNNKLVRAHDSFRHFKTKAHYHLRICHGSTSLGFTTSASHPRSTQRLRCSLSPLRQSRRERVKHLVIPGDYAVRSACSQNTSRRLLHVCSVSKFLDQFIKTELHDCDFYQFGIFIFISGCSS